jgi:hypothetical protein
MVDELEKLRDEYVADRHVAGLTTITLQCLNCGSTVRVEYDMSLLRSAIHLPALTMCGRMVALTQCGNCGDGVVFCCDLIPEGMTEEDFQRLINKKKPLEL